MGNDSWSGTKKMTYVYTCVYVCYMCTVEVFGGHRTVHGRTKWHHSFQDTFISFFLEIIYISFYHFFLLWFFFRYVSTLFMQLIFKYFIDSFYLKNWVDSGWRREPVEHSGRYCSRHESNPKEDWRRVVLS